MSRDQVVTGLRRAGRERVAVELDGAPWRVLPAEAVLAAGLDKGVTLDRERARRLAREVRRVKARTVALSALTRREHTAAMLCRRLEERGVAPDTRETTMAMLAQAGLIDDAGVAGRRAVALAERGAGDAMIRDDLERRGVATATIDESLASLEPELDRARRIVGPVAPSVRVLRRLAARGFGADVLEAVADRAEPELGCESFT